MTVYLYDDEAKQVLEDRARDRMRDLWSARELKTLFFEVTDSCNLACAHCGSRCFRGSSQGVPTETLLKTLRDAVSRLGVRPFINMTGGEPLLREDLFELGRGVRELGCMWGMTTNGTLIDGNRARRLVDAGCVSATVSLDGLRESHDRFRGCDGAWDKAWVGIENLIGAGMDRVDVMTVVHADNIAELAGLFELLQDIDIDSWRITFVDPMGRALDGSVRLLDYDQRDAVVDYVADLRRQGFPVSMPCQHFLGERELDVRNGAFMCVSGISIASIAANGDILGCLDCERVADTIFGNIYLDDFAEVWETGFGTYRNKRELLPEGCRSCEHVGRCLGGSMHTFDFSHHEQRVCMVRHGSVV